MDDRPRSLPARHSVLDGAPLAALAVKAYGLDPRATCVLYGRGLNDTYLVEASEHRWILRLYRTGWRRRSDVLFEIEAIEHAARAGVPVARPLPRRDGEWVTEVLAPEGLRWVVLFEHAGGDELSSREHPSTAYGAAVAAMHVAWEGFASDHDRFPLDIEHLVDEPAAAILPFLARRPDDEAFLRALAADLHERFESLPLDALEWGLCHGDCHGGNAAFAPAGALTFFDFDCCGFGYRAYEAAVFRWGRLHNAKDTADERWQAFLDGYATRRRLAETDLAAVPLFVIARQIWLMGLHCANADDWGARQWLTTRFFDQEIGRLADWLADLPGDGPVWACRR